MSRSLLALSITVGASVALFAQTPLPPTTPTPLWTISTGLASPESAYYHEASNSIFVSNINGQPLEKNANGYITRIAPSGRVLAEKWATGLNAPKGFAEAFAKEVANLTVLATEKVTRKSLDDSDHRRLIEEALGEVDFSQLAGDEGNGKH